jgi:hypothetical protein
MYWMPSNRWDEADLIKDNDRSGIWSDVVGECHRRAPSPTQAMMSRIASLIGEIAWASNEIANIESEEHGDYELGATDIYHIHEWPMTGANDWCGDFRQGRKTPSPEELEKKE